MKRIISLLSLTAVLACAGCTIASRVSVAKDGTQTTSKISTFLTTASGFQDSVTTPDGVVSSTSLANYSGDVQMANALFAGMNSLGAKFLLMGNTNLLNNTNLLAILSAGSGPVK